MKREQTIRETGQQLTSDTTRQVHISRGRDLCEKKTEIRWVRQCQKKQKKRSDQFHMPSEFTTTIITRWYVGLDEQSNNKKKNKRLNEKGKVIKFEKK
uniref:Uncharacterized protein n=1 Tax=Caenorhabditis tropicalis TaxID=1561998 RepID=A0A1I7TFW3_9PELO